MNKYEWRYVNSKYTILTREGADWDYRIIRYYDEACGGQDITESIRSNPLLDIILELLETRRALDLAESKLARLSQDKTLIDYEKLVAKSKEEN